MSLKAIDTGFLRNLITYDASGNISLPAGLSIFVNKEVATKEYVDAQNSGQVLQSRTLTINGVTFDLSANRSWTIDSMVYPSAGIALSSGTGWGTSIVNNSANWNTAFGWGNHASVGYVPYTGATTNVTLGAFNLTADNITLSSNLASLTRDAVNGIGVLRLNRGANGYIQPTTLSVDRTYTLPDASGTIALTSDLSGYVTLGNTQSISGSKIFQAMQFFNTYPIYSQVGIAIDYRIGASTASFCTTVGANVNGLQVNLIDGGYNNLNFASTTMGNTYTFPNASGTIALTSNIVTYSNFTRTVAGLVPNPGAATTTRYLREDGTWVIPPDTDTIYVHPTTAGNKHIPAGGAAGQILRYSSDGTAAWGADNDTTYTLAGLGGLPLNGNAVTASTFSTGRGNYKGVTDNAVAGQLMWKNYGNNHTIFDASASTSPEGGAVNNTNAAIAWSATYPTLMGWNGTSTYGVRVDSARVSDIADSAIYGRYVYDAGLNGGTVGYKEPSTLYVKYATDSLRTTYAEIGFSVRNYLVNEARNNEMRFYWVGQAGQPTWLWGSNNGTEIYVWNPANFSVNYATTAGSATDSTKLPLAGGTLTGDLVINGGAANLPLSMNSVEPYMHIIANGASNTAGIRLYPTNGYTALIGNFRPSGELALVASNVASVLINSNSIRVAKYRFNGNSVLSGNGTPEIVDKESVGMAMQSFSYVWYNSNATVLMMSLNSLGNLTANGFFESSDVRYKNIIETNPDLNLEELDVIKFTRKGNNVVRYGYSAQQVKSLSEDLVGGTNDELTVNYSDVHTLKIAALEKRIVELETKLNKNGL